MEELIKQAFLHVEVIGPRVQEGLYDLIGPDGEIILPSVWEKVIQPDWNITMHMWPMDKAPMQRPPQMHQMGPNGMPIPVRQAHPGQHQHPGARMHPGMMGGMRPPSARPGGQGPMGGPPPPPPNFPMGMGGMGQRPMRPHDGRGEPVIVAVEPGPQRKKSSSKSNTGMLSFLAGKPAKSSSKKYDTWWFVCC